MANITSNGTGGGNSNDGSTWTGGSVPTSSDNAIIQNGDTVTQNAVHTFKSLRVETGGTWTADGSNHLTLSGENDSDFALQIVDGTYNHANGTVVINNGGGGIAHAAIQAGDATSTTGLYDLTISGGGTTCEIYGDTTIHRNMEAGGATTVLRGALTVNGNLTVEATLNTRYSSTDRNLTVATNTVINGTLTGNDSTFTFGTDGVHGSTEGGCLLVNSAGTFTFGSGDVTIFSGFTAKGTEASPNVTSTGGGDILIKGRTNNGFMNSHSHQGTNITGDYIIDYDNNAIFDNRGGTTIACGTFIIKHDGRTYEPWNNSTQATFKIIGNMDIQNGTFDTEYSGQNSQHLTVTGRTDIGPASGVADQATLTCNASTVSLGSGRTSSFALVVNQGGTYTGGTGTHTIGCFEVKNNSNAKMTMTSGECTIDSENSGDGRAILVETNATFDNNDGTIKITHAGDTDIEFKSGTTSPKCPHNLTIDKSNNDVITHGNLRIDNNLFIKIVDTSHSMRPSSASDTLTVIGDVTLNKGKLGATTNYTSAISFGSLTIDADGEYIASSGTTTITTGAFDITTTSFDLGAKTLVFSGTNASFLSATNATFSAGPGATITGKAADDKTDFDCQKNFQVVGTVENLNNNGPGSLMVTGKVINCDGNIIQLKPTQDSEQQLDKSSEADRETTLGRDLDSNTELVG